MIFLAWLVQSATAAVGGARLVDGTPDFEDCIQNEGDCADRFFSFLSHSILEQGFAMQANLLNASPLLAGQGTFVGGQLSTFPFSPPQENLSGKEENTDFIPVFPKLHVGHRTEQKSFGFSLTPPVPVKGASAFFFGGRSGMVLNDNQSIELELGLLRATAPIAATDEQLENKDSFENPDNLNDAQFEERCGSQENGCIDTLWMTQVAARYLYRLPLGERMSLYAQGSLVVSTYRLYIMYDDTKWGVFSIQPTVHGGSFLVDTERITLTLGGGLGTLGPSQHRNQKFGLVGRVEGLFSLSF